MARTALKMVRFEVPGMGRSGVITLNAEGVVHVNHENSTNGASGAAIRVRLEVEDTTVPDLRAEELSDMCLILAAGFAQLSKQILSGD